MSIALIWLARDMFIVLSHCVYIASSELREGIVKVFQQYNVRPGGLQTARQEGGGERGLSLVTLLSAASASIAQLAMEPDWMPPKIVLTVCPFWHKFYFSLLGECMRPSGDLEYRGVHGKEGKCR